MFYRDERRATISRGVFVCVGVMRAAPSRQLRRHAVTMESSTD